MAEINGLVIQTTETNWNDAFNLKWLILIPHYPPYNSVEKNHPLYTPKNQFFLSLLTLGGGCPPSLFLSSGRKDCRLDLGMPSLKRFTRPTDWEKLQRILGVGSSFTGWRFTKQKTSWKKKKVSTIADAQCMVY